MKSRFWLIDKVPPRGEIKQRNPERIDLLLDLIGKIWKKNPDLRLGQLFIITANKNRDWRVSIEEVIKNETVDLFHIEDDELYANLFITYGLK